MFEKFIAALRSHDPYVRDGALYALNRLNDAQAVPSLIALLKESPHNPRLYLIRPAILAALKRIGTNESLAAVQAWKAQQAIEKKDFWLAQLRQGDDPELCMEAARCLGQLGDRRAIEPLRAMLKNKYGDLRSAAAEALGRLGAVQSVGDIIPLLNDHTKLVLKSGRVNQYAAQALECIGTDEALQAVADWKGALVGVNIEQ
jgi:hypothetical protein